MISSLCQGTVRHRRFTPREHEFTYQFFMPAIDLRELAQLDQEVKWFSHNHRNWVSLWRKDYMPGVEDLQQAVLASELANKRIEGNVLMLANMRYAGIYFSPVNFYFIGEPNAYRYMIAEVSNTPWNERHCYLVDLDKVGQERTEKRFYVSPFNPMDMQYRWGVKLNDKRVTVHIENWREQKEFDATMILTREPLTGANLRRAILGTPAMSIKIVSSIYWEALKLFFIKRVPYYPHL